jgi:hypothetical protein
MLGRKLASADFIGCARNYKSAWCKTSTIRSEQQASKDVEIRLDDSSTTDGRGWHPDLILMYQSRAIGGATIDD